MKRSVTLIISIAALGILIGTYFLVKAKPWEKEEEYTYTSTMIKLSDITEDQVVRAEYIREDDTLSLVKQEGEWILDYPYPIEPKPYTASDVASGVYSIYADRVIDEEPSDISLYGLDSPLVTGVAILEDGSRFEYYLGEQTPTGDTYYFMRQGDPKVYTILRYTAERYLKTIDEMRETQIAGLDPMSVQYVKFLNTRGRVIEIIPREIEEKQVSSTFSSVKMAKPFIKERGVDTQNFSNFVQAFNQSLNREAFIEDAPGHLAEYGLDPPAAEVLMRDAENMLHVYYGDVFEDGYRYARLADSEQVFVLPTVSSVQVYENTYENIAFLDMTAFAFVDKFIMIPNIDTVDAFVVETAEGDRYESVITRVNKPGTEEVEDTFAINGKEVEDKAFRQYYQKVIGLFSDAENPDPQPLTSRDIVITYRLNNEFERASVVLQKINRNFYAAYVDGLSELLVSDYQVAAIFQDLDTVLAD